ncbi:cytochrome P450 [Trametes elegans]|nr:cytochrome P450 [Trametes elegans]
MALTLDPLILAVDYGRTECVGLGATVYAYQPVQLEATHRFLLCLVQNPDLFPEHIGYANGSSIIRLAYGIDIDRESTPYLPIASAAMETVNAAFVPGKFLVETFPVLRFLPAWLPGAGFKRKAPAWRALLYTTTMTFFLAMAMDPEVQRRAQAELAAIVGPHRLPTFDDWPSLPYVTAIMRECMRWGLILPLGFAHRSVGEDEYRGHYIPKGTLIIHNAWPYTRHEQHYPEPEDFRPERYLKHGEIDPDPSDIAFGYGRRVCPSRGFGMAALSALMASVLHTFNISSPLDAGGKPLPLERKASDGGALAILQPFECTIEPRSTEAEVLILAAN